MRILRSLVKFKRVIHGFLTKVDRCSRSRKAGRKVRLRKLRITWQVGGSKGRISWGLDDMTRYGVHKSTG